MDTSADLKRILLKLSGEALLGEVDYGIDPAVIKRIAAKFAMSRRSASKSGS